MTKSPQTLPHLDNGQRKPVLKRQKTAATLVLNSAERFWDLSCLYTGLDALARQDLITFTTRFDDSCHGPLLELSNPDAPAQKIIAIDLHDSSCFFRQPALAQCDTYFKRNFRPHDTNSLPPALSAKVVPLGLNFLCRSKGGTSRLLRTIAVKALLAGRRGFSIVRSHLRAPSCGGLLSASLSLSSAGRRLPDPRLGIARGSPRRSGNHQPGARRRHSRAQSRLRR